LSPLKRTQSLSQSVSWKNERSPFIRAGRSVAGFARPDKGTAASLDIWSDKRRKQLERRPGPVVSRASPGDCLSRCWKKGQRCLVVTDGFYEWKKPEKQPYAVAMADKSHMVMSCTIITCPLIGTLHDRMPVILAEEDWAEWLGEEPAMPEEIKALLVPYRDDGLTMWPVNRQRIGNVRNKDREVALPEALS